MFKSEGWPSLLVLDVWPISRPLLVFTNYEIVEQLSETIKLGGSIQTQSIISAICGSSGPNSSSPKFNEEWEAIRNKYEAVLAHQHHLRLAPSVMGKTQSFLNNLDTFAVSGDTFPLLQLCLDLSFDIMCKLVLGLDVDAQEFIPGPFAQDFNELLTAYDGLLLSTPGWLMPLISLKRRHLRNSVNNALEKCVLDILAPTRRGSPFTDHDESVLSRLLRHDDTPIAEVISKTCNQLKSSLLSGRQATGVLLAWAIYELSITPHALEGIRNEVQQTIGQDADPVILFTSLVTAKITGQDILEQMPYTHAVLRETLRLHPPEGPLIYVKDGSNFNVYDSSTRETRRLDGSEVYLCMPAILRDPNVYGEIAESFSPERWLDHTTSSKISAIWGSLQTVSQGYIGPELAMPEICLVLVLVSQRYTFRKRSLGEPDLDTEGGPVLDPRTGQYKVTETLYNVRHLSPFHPVLEVIHGVRWSLRDNDKHAHAHCLGSPHSARAG